VNGRFSGEKLGGTIGIQSFIALNDADDKKIIKYLKIFKLLKTFLLKLFSGRMFAEFTYSLG
tara:strand:- start:5 stop:190 length:186 start_codon:yes stop_codon:yes gene_type:complete